MGPTPEAVFQNNSRLAGTAVLEPAADQTPQEDPSAACNVDAMLPWVVLFGRCCSIWAKQLLQGALGQHPQGPKSLHLFYLPYTTILEIFTRRVGPMTPELLLTLQMHSVFGLDPTIGDQTVAVSCLKSVRAWLCLPSTVQQLTAAGYDMVLLQSQMAAAVEAALVVQQVAAAAPGALHPAVAQLVQGLHALGESLSAFAISSACNNPACSNITAASEAQLVKGRSRTCAGCRKARYCCKACQTQHWKLHKPVCKALAAAGAACGVL